MPLLIIRSFYDRCNDWKTHLVFYFDLWEKYKTYLEYSPDLTRKEIKAQNPLFDYIQSKYADYYIKKIDDYVREELKKVLNN